MILVDFFEYYFKKVDPGVKERILSVLPAGMEKTAENIASMFRRNDLEALEFLMRFHEELEQIRANDPYNCITFNLCDNVCFPFFIDYIWGRLPQDVRLDIEKHLDANGVEEVNAKLQAERENRNWFRKRTSSVLTQDDLFSLSEVIALQNFNSGGENSFLNLVYPRIKNIRGKILDGGCGAGFASLVMSQFAEVCGIDACTARLNRAQGIAQLMKEGERSYFPHMLQLIEDELGTLSVEAHFPTADELLSGNAKEVSFVHGSLDSLPYGEREFDAILCMDVLEHTYDPGKIIAQFAKVAKPGAPVFITAPNSYGEIYQKFAEDEEGTAFPAMLHMHHFEPETLNELFGANGFEPEVIEPFDYIARDEFERMLRKHDPSKLSMIKPDMKEIPAQIFAIYKKK